MEQNRKLRMFKSILCLVKSKKKFTYLLTYYCHLFVCLPVVQYLRVSATEYWCIIIIMFTMSYFPVLLAARASWFNSDHPGVMIWTNFVLFCQLSVVANTTLSFLVVKLSDLVTSTDFLSTTEYSAKSHSPIRPWQPVSHRISTISSNYTSHHELSILQPSNYSKCHICLQILVGAPSATALLQHVIPFLLPLKIAHFYIVSSAT